MLLSKPDSVLEAAHVHSDSASGNLNTKLNILSIFYLRELGSTESLPPKVPLTACYNSTIADALVDLLRLLHVLPAWTSLINKRIFSGIEANYVAALAFLGGATSKPRLGGDVVHDSRQGKCF